MRFFNVAAFTLAFISLSAFSQQDVSDISKGSDAQREYIEKLNSSGILKEFAPESIEQQIKPYDKVAKKVSDNSISQLAVSLNTYLGVPEAQANMFGGASGNSENRDSLTGIFVSFSMPDAELKEAFKEAELQGGELYFIGMHPNDKHIGDTIKRLSVLMAGSQTTANARFHPKAFEEFGIQSVPAILHAQKGSVGLIHGLMNIDYLKRQMEEKTGFNDFGVLGPTRPVMEQNLLDAIKDRIANIDEEGLKQRAVDNFWKKKDYTLIPAATKTEEFYINPTVKVMKDIINPNGDVLARAGDVINPLDNATMLNTYILFDATDIRQLEWVDALMNKNEYKGIVMLMTSKINKNDGWNHLSALRKHFYREIYMIPKELVERFNITGLPAVVTTDLNKKMLKINQYSIKDEE